MYKEVLYTVTHKLGSSQAVHGSGQLHSQPQTRYDVQGSQSKKQYNMLKGELMQYAQDAFNVTEQQHIKIMSEATDEKVSELCTQL